MDSSVRLRIQVQGSLDFGKAPVHKRAIKSLEKANPPFFPKELKPAKIQQDYVWEGEGTWKEWAALVQALQALAIEAVGGAIQVKLPEIEDAREIRCGGWQRLLLDELPPGAQSRIVPLACRALSNPHTFSYSEDGKWLAIGTSEGMSHSDTPGYVLASDVDGEYWGEQEVLVWDRTEETLAHRFLGRSLHVHQVVFSPDARSLLCISKERAGYPYKGGKSKDGYYQNRKGMSARLFDLSTGSAPVVGPKGAIAGAFSHDGRRLAVCGEKTLTLWDVEKGKALYKEKADHDYSHVAFSDDDRFLAVYSEGAAVVDSWEVEGWKHLHHLRIGAMTNTYSMVFLPESHVIFCTVSGREGFFDVSTGEQVPCPLQLDGLAGKSDSSHGEGWEGKAILEPGERVLLIWGEHKLTRWDLKTNALIAEIPVPVEYPSRHSVKDLHIDPLSSELVVTSDCSSLCLQHFSLTTGHRTDPKPAHSSTMLTTLFMPDNRLFAMSTEPVCSIWEPESGELVRELEIESYLHRGRVTPDGRYLVGDDSKECCIVEVSTGQMRRVGLAGYASSVAMSPDGTTFAVGQNCCIELIDIASASLRSVAVDGWISLLCYVSESVVAANTSDGHSPRGLQLLDVETGRSLKQAEIKNASLLQFSSEERELVVVTSSPGGIHFLDVETLEAKRPALELDWGGFRPCAVSAQGEYVAGLLGHILRVFDTRDGSVVMTRVGHPRYIFSTPSFSPDGRWVVTGGDEGTAVVWRMP